MVEIVKQGQVSVTGTILYTGTASSPIVKVINLRFNNPAAYTLRLDRYNAGTSNTETLYELTLSAGDTVTDPLVYPLNEGDQLIVYSNILGTVYYSYILDYATN